VAPRPGVLTAGRIRGEPDDSRTLDQVTPEQLSQAVIDTVRNAVDDGELAVAVPEAVTVERPKNRDHGDYATNVALQLAKAAGRPPREVAELLAARLRRVDGVKGVEIAGPGFLNFRLDAAAAGELARSVVAAGAAYGRTDTLAGQNLNLEFVSANPTGPVHLGGARWAAVGDALARLLEASGAKVGREYYFNDAGAQIDRFARSLLAAATGKDAPEDGYGGAYIGEIAQAVIAQTPSILELDEASAQEVFRVEGIALMLAEIKKSLAEFGVHFDTYFSESSLHDRGELTVALERLRAQGHVFEKDGATWLRTTDFGDDKDRVVVRSSGEWTYFAADCAYYLDKRERGFDKVVIMLGADHHGYIGRMKAMAACFGDDPDANLEILIGQMVNLIKDGEPVKMSKRAGTVVTLDDVLEAVGADAARYTLARSSVDSSIDLDIDLLTSAKNENRVWYVQYAYSRTFAVKRNAAELGLDKGSAAEFQPELLTHERETALLGRLGQYSRYVAKAAGSRLIFKVPYYLEDLAKDFLVFQADCRILPQGDEPFTDEHRSRLWLAEATQTVLRNGLHLLGVSAPERM
jgi:arginyl-tRNA synthetase